MLDFLAKTNCHIAGNNIDVYELQNDSVLVSDWPTLDVQAH